MFLNYLAGAISLVLAISAFLPWVTLWFYSIKGIESIYGILVLLVGLLGILVAIFQHLSGKTTGRAYIVLSGVGLVAEVLYFRKLHTYGSNISQIVGLLKDVLGPTISQKVQKVVGEAWMNALTHAVQRFAPDTSISGFDFIGGGLMLATVASIALLVIGFILERKKTLVE